MPSALVNSVMTSPQPVRLRMNWRKTVSVTPAMGARTVAGAISTALVASGASMGKVAGTRTPAGISLVAAGFSQYLRIRRTAIRCQLSAIGYQLGAIADRTTFDAG